MRVIKWGVKVKLSALESRTWYLTEDRDYHMFPMWAHFISLDEELISFCHWQKLPKRELVCFTCLLRCIDHTNVISKLKELSTAVKTAKTKVPVTCVGNGTQGWETPGNSSYPPPISLQHGLLTGSMGWFLPLDTYSSYTPYVPAAGLIHMGLWVSFISPILPKQQKVWDSFLQGRNQTSFSTCVCAKSLKLCLILQPHGR